MKAKKKAAPKRATRLSMESRLAAEIRASHDDLAGRIESVSADLADLYLHMSNAFLAVKPDYLQIVHQQNTARHDDEVTSPGGEAKPEQPAQGEGIK